MPYQRLRVREVIFAVPERTGPISPAMVKLAIQDQQLQGHDGHDSRFGMAVDKGRNNSDATPISISQKKKTMIFRTSSRIYSRAARFGRGSLRTIGLV